MCKCAICNEEIKGTVHKDHDYNLCEECYFEDEYTFCHNCDKLIMKNDSYEYNDRLYCEDCMVTCEDCNTMIPCDEIYVTNSDRRICESCYDDGYFTCERCGEIESYEDGIRFEDSYYCDYCYNEVLCDYGIHKYDYKPSVEFHHTENETQLRENNLHVGIELEIQGWNRLGFCNDIVDKYDYDDGMFYLKTDGSLSDDGIELISQPMTLDFICNSNDWKYCFDKMNINNMDDIIGCGLHFHLDKKYLTNKDIAIIDYIVNNFDSYFQKLGGREYSYYCRKSDKQFDDWGKDVVNRYHAVNLCNLETVELRFCESTNDYNTFLQRTKMIFTIVEFAKKYNNIIEISEWLEDEFIEKFNEIYKEKFGIELNIA